MACQGFLTRLLAACQGSRHSHRQRGGRGSEAVPGVSVLGRGPAPPRAEQCGGLLGPILLQHPQRTAGTPQVLPLCEPCWLSSSCWAWLCVKGWFWSYWSVLGAGAASGGQQPSWTVPSLVAAVPRQSGVATIGTPKASPLL